MLRARIRCLQAITCRQVFEKDAEIVSTQHRLRDHPAMAISKPFLFPSPFLGTKIGEILKTKDRRRPFLAGG